MMDNQTNIQKIIVGGDFELTDVIREIHKSKAEKIILTFTESNDLLISPINLKVIQESIDKENKLLIAQIIQNPTGVRNSKLANIKVIESPSNPTDQDWEDALEMRDSKKQDKVKRDTTPNKIEEEKKSSSFEDRVNNAISKSSTYERERVIPKPVQSEEDLISIDGDIPQKEDIEIVNHSNPEPQETLAGKDFVSVTDPNIKKDTISSKPTLKVPNIQKPNIKIDNKVLKLLPKLLIPLVVVLLIGAVIYYNMAPFVKVKIFVEAKPVEIEKIFTGDTNIDDVDFDNLKIPIKSEEVTKSLSDNITPTGKAYKGDKAKGVVRITYTKGQECSDADTPITLNVGQVITSQNYSYKLTGTAQLTCNSMTDVNVEASDIGEEYNIPASRFFTIGGYSSNEVYGLNSAAFSGGSKQEYTVLSQQDVDTAVENLSSTAIEEVKNELRDKNNGWEIIENTIKSEVDKNSIKTDIPVGGEGSNANIQLSIKGTATYYSIKNLNEGLTDILRVEANSQNLFENSKDLNLVLGDNIEKELSVESTTDNIIKIKLVASANIKPDVNKTDIENKLKGMKWDEGLAYLSDLTFAAQQTEVEFKPDTFPKFLKYFPNRRGGVMISVIELESN